MKLCVNYMNEVKELYNEGKIDFVDYIKLYSIDADLSPFDWCASVKDVMFHGLVGDGSSIANENFMEGRDIKLQKEYFRRGNTPYISVHISRHKNYEKTEDECAKIISENIAELRRTFGMDVIVENVPVQSKQLENRFLSTPEFITRVVRENNCGFLFDIGHARSAAESLKIPFENYVERLPMDRLIETHLAGCMHHKDGRIVPNHSKMNEEDYAFLKVALEKYPTLQVVTLEYGPFVENDLIEECPMVNMQSVNEKAKEEVMEQLLRIKTMIEESVSAHGDFRDLHKLD